MIMMMMMKTVAVKSDAKLESECMQMWHRNLWHQKALEAEAADKDALKSRDLRPGYGFKRKR